MDCSLPFGLRLVPLILSAVADALEWIVRSRGVTNIFHYINHYILVGPPVCELSLRTLTQTCDILGVPITQEKDGRPSHLPHSVRY